MLQMLGLNLYGTEFHIIGYMYQIKTTYINKQTIIFYKEKYETLYFLNIQPVYDKSPQNSFSTRPKRPSTYYSLSAGEHIQKRVKVFDKTSVHVKRSSNFIYWLNKNVMIDLTLSKQNILVFKTVAHRRQRWTGGKQAKRNENVQQEMPRRSPPAVIWHLVILAASET